MKKIAGIVLAVLLCPLATLAEVGSAGSAGGERGDPIQAALRVEPVRELAPARLAALASANLRENFTRPRAHHMTSEGSGKVAIGIGAGLAAVGIVVAATAYESKTVTEPFYSSGPGYTSYGTVTYTTSGTNMGRRWGGVAVAGGGGALVIYGILKIRE